MRKRLISLGLSLAAALALAPAAAAAPFKVDNSGDASDAVPGNGVCATATGECTLRAAIQESNATATGAPHRIWFSVAESLAASPLPAITRDGTFVDGCNVGLGDPPFSTPRTPAGAPCVDLRGAGAADGLQVGDASGDTSGVSIYNLAFTGFPGRALRIWGADRTRVGGNLFGRRVNGTAGPNGVAVNVSGRTQNGALANPAIGNLIGGPSRAVDTDDPPACDDYCNTIVGSTTAGIDLVGAPSPLNDADAPAGGAGGADEGTVIAGNWIGVRDASGTADGNAVAIKLGNSLETTIGDVVLGQCNDQSNCKVDHSNGNVIAGNGAGVDQGTGTTSAWLLGGVYGLSPDRDTSVPNGQFNARLGGSNTFGGGAFVQGATFGPAPIGLELVGPRALVIASLFFAPAGSSARFTTAAIRIGPQAELTRIGSNLATPFGCLLVLVDYCNTIGSTAPGAPGIWVDGADDTTIWRNAIGLNASSPLQGPPIRVDGGAVGADIGDNDEDPKRMNNLVRLAGPAVEVGGGASKVMIGGNQGLALQDFGQPSGLFTDLLPVPGPGNSGSANNGIQPPAVTVASVNGAGGTGIPGARIDLLVQEGPFDPKDPDVYQEGTTYPPTPAVTTVAPDGIWGVAFPAPLKQGLKLLAAQTTPADGSSEYASPQAAQSESPPPVVTFHSGPTGVVAERSATFTFSANKPASRLHCNIDAAGFVPCSSPLTLTDLSIGGHQLQVRATDPTGKQGAPASRTWIVEIPQPPAPAPAAKAAAVRFTQVASLPSARRCVSRRSMRITIRNPRGGPKVRTAQARIGGRRAKTRRGAGSITLSLKGLPRGRFVARVKVTLTDGRVINGTRTYRTCAETKKR